MTKLHDIVLACLRYTSRWRHSRPITESTPSAPQVCAAHRALIGPSWWRHSRSTQACQYIGGSGLRGVLCAIIIMSPNFDSWSWPIGDRKKTWVHITDVGQKGVIQYGVQDGRRTLIPSITPSGSALEEWWIWCLYLRFGGQGIDWNYLWLHTGPPRPAG